MKYLYFLVALLVGLVNFSQAGDSRCSLTIKKGPCLGYIKMYAYDSAAGGCTEFIYGGCQGNENRFDTMEECKKICE
nr:serine protease inhibitor Kunitz type 1 [Andraca theae]